MPTDASVAKPRVSFLSLLRHYTVSAVHRFRKLSIRGKILIIAVLLFYCSLPVFVIVLKPARIAQYFYDSGQKIRDHPLGWLLLYALIQIVSIPPMIGHTTMLNLCGFTYGLKGFLVAAPASLVASALVFVVLRYMFSERLRTWSATNEKWQALETVVDSKGLPLIILIRLSPFPPWPYSNAMFASIASVSVWQFMVATLCTLPRYLLYVFIGSRMAALSDGKQRDQMDKQTKIVNGVLIAVGILAGVAAGSSLYILMKRQLRGVSPKTDELASEAIEDADEGAPLLGNFSSESLHEDV
ncbi:Golgi apparatus membrane protein TVP38 [Gloeopeniophorella convolvens]|nr:Golgi apparatus membrane protein TVP38 [Gloeopeniophorella convolvens]